MHTSIDFVHSHKVIKVVICDLRYHLSDHKKHVNDLPSTICWNMKPQVWDDVLWFSNTNIYVWSHKTSILRWCSFDSGYCLNQAFWYALRIELGSSQWGGVGSPQTATDVVAKQSLGSWSLLWSLNSHSGCGSTSLLVLMQGLAR